MFHCSKQEIVTDNAKQYSEIRILHIGFHSLEHGILIETEILLLWSDYSSEQQLFLETDNSSSCGSEKRFLVG